MSTQGLLKKKIFFFFTYSFIVCGYCAVVPCKRQFLGLSFLPLTMYVSGTVKVGSKPLSLPADLLSHMTCLMQDGFPFQIFILRLLCEAPSEDRDIVRCWELNEF